MHSHSFYVFKVDFFERLDFKGLKIGKSVCDVITRVNRNQVTDNFIDGGIRQIRQVALQLRIQVARAGNRLIKMGFFDKMSNVFQPDQRGF